MGCLMKYAPIVGPIAKPKKNTPVKREKILARDPSEVQSDTYAEVALCRVDHPPSKPSMIGEMMSSLCPCTAKILCGVETRMNVRSLQECCA